MLSAIDLDDEPSLKTDEIDDVTVQRFLPSEAPSFHSPVAQQTPQCPLRISQRHSARALCAFGAAPSSSFG
jgi:hypothetical protein